MRDTRSLFDRSARKRPANLSLNSDLLEQARALEINLSATLEEALIDRIRRRKREAWTQENQGAIEEYNERIDADGAFGDRVRRF